VPTPYNSKVVEMVRAVEKSGVFHSIPFLVNSAFAQ
jgi:hypothetical protein